MIKNDNEYAELQFLLLYNTADSDELSGNTFVVEPLRARLSGPWLITNESLAEAVLGVNL